MDTSEYLPMFLAECRENLQELNLAVVRLEEAPEDRETIDAIFRIAHSLKGMAATMGFEGMARLTHKMEDVFELLRQRGTGLTGEVADTVLAVLDAVATERATTVAAVALAWLLGRPGVVAPIASARNPAQLAELLPAAALSLLPAEMDRLDAASRGPAS